MTNTIKFNSVSFAVTLEKSMNKGINSLVTDFIRDMEKANSAESIKTALKAELKKAGFVPSNSFSMKTLNSASALFSAGIKSENVNVIVSFCKIKPSEGYAMTEKKIALMIEKYGKIESVISEAIKASTPESKKQKKSESAKRGAQTRIESKKGSVIPSAVVKANQSTNLTAEKPLEYQATPRAQLDRAINCFLALSEEGKADFVKAVRKELNLAVLSISKTNEKKKVA